jgi:MSHA biogenesis protein MshP
MLKTFEKGFALPSAIFLLVILSLMSIAVFAINGYSQKASIYDVSDTKAYFAAKAGLEYGSYIAAKTGSCSSTAQTVDLSATYFKGFKATYSCVANNVDEAGVVQTYYTITSSGCNSSNISCPESSGRPLSEDYVEKSMTTIIAKN